MLEIVNFFKKETYNDDVFGSTVFFATVFAVLDILIRTGQLKIIIPEDFVAVNISVKLENLLAISPCLVLLFFALLNVMMSKSYTGKEDQEKSLIQYYSILTGVCLIYTLYRFFVACGLVVSEQAIKPSALDNGVVRILLVIVSYSLIFIFFVFTTIFKVESAHRKREKWDISSLKSKKEYNTITFQFDNKLNDEQIIEIIGVIKNVVHDKTDVNLSLLLQEFEKVLYLNISANSITLGQIDKKYDSYNEEYGFFLSFWAVIEQLNKHFTEFQYKYHTIISHEKYMIMPIDMNNPLGVGNIKIVKYNK